MLKKDLRLSPARRLSFVERERVTYCAHPRPRIVTARTHPRLASGRKTLAKPRQLSLCIEYGLDVLLGDQEHVVMA